MSEPTLPDYDFFPNASPSFRALNPQLGNPKFQGQGARDGQGTHDAVRGELEPSNGVGNVGKGKAKVADSRRFLVCVTSIRRILLDEDNLCEKYVVDCCRYSGLLPGDRPGQTKIEVRQRKAGKEERERTVVEIFELAYESTAASE